MARISFLSEDFRLLPHCLEIKSFPPPWLDSPSGLGPSHCRGFDITLRYTTCGRTPLDERSAVTETSTSQHSQETYMPPAGLEPAIPGSERLQTDALDRAATGIGKEL
jgi:hypothetical protein